MLQLEGSPILNLLVPLSQQARLDVSVGTQDSIVRRVSVSERKRRVAEGSSSGSKIDNITEYVATHRFPEMTRIRGLARVHKQSTFR